MRLFKSLYWKISCVFLLLMVIIGGVYVYVTAIAADEFFLETKQTLNKDVASELIHEVPIFINDSLNEGAVQKIMMHHMKVNPTVEVYILDPMGKILTYDAPPEKIKKSYVSIAPIKELIRAEGESYILGNDPRNPDACKVFSVAPIYDKNAIQGYVYVILASEEYDSVSSMLMGNFIYSVGIKTFIITVLFAVLIGLISIKYLTRNLKIIEDGVAEFSKGKYDQRIQLPSQGEFSHLAHCLNDMAGTISNNIDQLKSIEKLRKELVANVSHDLRTPIAVVRGYIETMLMKNEEMSSEDREKYLNIVLSSTQNLENLVSDLFELSKLDSEKVELKKERVNLLELLNDLSLRYKIIADQRSLEFEVVGVDMGIVEIDIALMERAIQNLIENSMKFTPKGGKVTIELKRVKQSLLLTVKDTGVGIAEEYLPFVFDRYKKLDSDKTHNAGAGLGLAIVKRIMELHQLNIEVNSEKNKGTNFSIAIPVV